MDIKLGYIEGISNIDTPYFSNISAQNDFFTNHQVTSISTTFYPPHYRNRIRFDVEDIDFTNQINYLWFEYNSKVYYYFINDIEYLNENTIELEITMDVIQTYFFNIKFSNAIIERKFINRWTDSTHINREYLRENVSSGLFTKQKTTLSQHNLWLVAKVSHLPHPNTQGYDVLTKITINNKIAYVPYGYLYLPLFCDSIRVITGYTEDDVPVPIYTTYSLFFDYILEILSSDYVLDAYIIDYNPRPDVFTISNSVLSIATYFDDTALSPLYGERKVLVRWKANSVLLIESGENVGLICEGQSHMVDKDVTQYDNNLLRPKNTSLGVNFDKKYITQLLDENYIRIEYGNGGGVATYPLSVMRLNSLTLSQYYNLDDGSKIFAIHNDSSDESLYNGLDYQTYVFSNIKPTLPLLNDAWKSYQANNQGRWVSAGIGTVKNAITSFIGVPLKNTHINNRITTLLSDPKKYDKRYKNLTLKDSFLRKLDELDIRKASIKGDIGKGILDVLSPLISQGVEDFNAQLSPDSIRMSGDFISAYLSTQYITMYRHLEVNDIEQCANYYHRNGFKVDEYVNAIEHPFEYVRTRYYFNIIKVSDCDLHLRNYIENESDMENIKDRLKDGIRLWNVENVGVSIGDFTYDNVELDYLS